MSRYFTIDGEPMTLMEWSAAFEDTPSRIIGKTKVGDAEVSTVWLGLDHSFGDGEPLIFETMIFGGDHSDAQWRYSTKEQAEEGHRQAVLLVGGKP